jgi:tetratricopeptide (TPR) repeat protein
VKEEPVKLRAFAIGVALAALTASLCVDLALARNEHCAGGIQYVVGGMRDKEKGNTEDYVNQMRKAVAQLEMCAEGDPADFEAMGYLGWAYCELDSAGPAGAAFKKCMDGLAAKGDKKLQQWKDNRQSYWVKYYNDGITKMKAAQELYPDLGPKPKNDGDAEVRMFNDARAKYEQAIVTFTKATLLKPEDVTAYLSMGQAYQFVGRFDAAEAALKAGLAMAPSDTLLNTAMMNLRKNKAIQLITDKKYDEAIAFYQDLLQAEPGNGEMQLGLGNAAFEKAQTAGLSDADKKRWFKTAGEAWAKAGEVKTGDFDLAYNSGVAFQNGGDPVQAETQFRRALVLNPEDSDVARALGRSLIDQGKYVEAVAAVFKALQKNPKKSELHQLLGAAYDKGGNKPKSQESAMVFMAMRSGTPVADASAAATAATGVAEANTLKALGKPDQVLIWKADQETYSTWIYWARSLAFHFKAGNLVMKSDWSSAGTVTNTPAK